MTGRRPTLRPAVLAAILAIVGPTAFTSSAHAESVAEIEAQVLVRYVPGTPAGDRADARADAGVTLDGRIDGLGIDVTQLEAGQTREQALATLERDPGVLFAEPNRVIRASTTDALWRDQWGLENLGDFGGVADADIDAPEAWTRSTGTGVTVGVVDTGVARAHQDLAGQLVTGVNLAGDGRLNEEDGNGHGTHVAGIIAAAQNAIGVSGVAPTAKVEPYRVLNDQGVGSSAASARAFRIASAVDGLRIVNASFGSPDPSQSERAAIAASPNTLFVVAAGNDGQALEEAPSYPCAYDLPNVLCVGASTRTDAPAVFSNRSAMSVDLFAPGQSIQSTWPDPTVAAPNAYKKLSGTSMATPMVAGAAALVLARSPGLSTAELKAALLDSVDQRPELSGLSVTGGRLDAARAVGVVSDPAVPGAASSPSTPVPVAVQGPVVTPTPEPTAAPEIPPTAKPSIVEPEGTTRRSTPDPTPRPAPRTVAISRLRVIASHGWQRAIAFDLSAQATVRVTATRRPLKHGSPPGRPTVSTTRTFTLLGGAQRVGLRGADGLGLTRGRWVVAVEAPGARGFLSVTVR